MKKFWLVVPVLVWLIVMAMLVIQPVAAAGFRQTAPPISVENLALLGAVASILTFIFSTLLTYGKIQIGRVWANIILFAVSLLLAVKWAGLAFPPLPSDVGGLYDWLNSLLLLVMPILGTASFIYNLLYSKVVVPLTVRLIKN